MSLMTRVLPLAVAALFLASCKPGTPAPAAPNAASTPRSEPARAPVTASTTPAASPAAAAESLAAFAARIRVECSQDRGNLTCVGGKPENGDLYDVELRPDCGPDGFFGGVAEESGAELRDALPPKDEKTLAVVPKGQLLCIEAIGRAGQQPEYFYVTTIQVPAVAACKGNRLCDLYGDRRVDMKSGPSPCPVTGDRSCAAGWIDADTVESFENGM
jgi:hypothetical protein